MTPPVRIAAAGDIHASEEHRDRLTCRRLILTHLDGDMHRRVMDAEEEVAEDGMVIDL